MKRILLIGLLGIFGALALQAAPSPWGLSQETADTLSVPARQKQSQHIENAIQQAQTQHAFSLKQKRASLIPLIGGQRNQGGSV